MRLLVFTPVRELRRWLLTLCVIRTKLLAVAADLLGWFLLDLLRVSSQPVQSRTNIEALRQLNLPLKVLARVVSTLTRGVLRDLLTR